MRVDLSRADEGATRLDLADDEQRERAASRRDPTD
jgi:hypothetical protein